MRAFLLLICFACTSCGWHFANSYVKNDTRTLSIPYVQGDHDGLLTAELIAQIEKEGSFTYVQEGGEYTLQVVLLDSKSDTIGYRWDPKKLASGKRKIIPNEARRRLLAKVSVVQSLTNTILVGPAYIVAETEFDHENYNLNHNINNFSLGQLTDIDTTYDVIDIPLHRDLGKKIALYLENHLSQVPAPQVPASTAS